MAVDELLYDELQLQTAIKSILKHEEDLKFASHNFGNFQNRVDKE